MVFEYIRINKNLEKDLRQKYVGRLWTFSLPTHKLSNLLLLLKTPAGSPSILFHVKLLRKKGYMMHFSWAFLKCLPIR